MNTILAVGTDPGTGKYMSPADYFKELIEKLGTGTKEAIDFEIISQMRWFIFVLIIVTIITLFQIFFNFSRSRKIASLYDNIRILNNKVFIPGDGAKLPAEAVQNSKDNEIINELQSKIEELKSSNKKLEDELEANKKKMNDEIMDIKMTLDLYRVILTSKNNSIEKE